MKIEIDNNFTPHKNIIMEVAQQQGGRWYGRVVDIFDKHGNELDACLKTKQETVECLLGQVIEIYINER